MADLLLTPDDQAMAREALYQIEAATGMLMAFITDARSEHSSHVRATCVRVQELSNALLSVLELERVDAQRRIYGLQQ